MIKKQKYRKQALKGACSRLRTMGVHYLGAGCKLKENKITITKKKEKKKKGAGDLPGVQRPPSPRCSIHSHFFMYKQRLGRRGAAAHRIDPNRMVHHCRLWIGVGV